MNEQENTVATPMTRAAQVLPGGIAGTPPEDWARWIVTTFLKAAAEDEELVDRITETSLGRTPDMVLVWRVKDAVRALAQEAERGA